MIGPPNPHDTPERSNWRAPASRSRTAAGARRWAVGLIGWSFGGYTAPRAAGREHRLAACVADSGPYDLYDTVIARMPGVLAHQLPDGNRVLLSVLEKALESTMKKPSAGWALRRNLWVHGVEDPMAYVELAREYSMKGREHLVRCPTFVCRTAGDDICADAQELADHLTSPGTAR